MADSTDQISDPLAARRSAAAASSFSADPSGRIGGDSRRITPRSPRAALEPERVPMPTKWSKSARHPLVIAGNAVFTILILLAIIVGVGFAVGKHRFDAPGPLAEDKVVNIPPRSGIRDIADLLTKEGVIEHPLTFIAGSLLAKTHEELRFGEYQFTKQASLQDVLNTLVSNKVVQHQVTIAEGLTSEQIVQRLLDADMLAGNIREIPREGSLLPESYRFTRSTPRDQVIQRMQAAQKRVVQEVWDHRAPDLPLRSPEQLVTLASIVEKETGRADERTRVAAVFVNRLKQRMRLQSDPTIIYGLVGGKGTLGPADHAQRNRAADALQHLCHRGAAAWPDRQSRARGARGGRQSRPHQGALFRRRRHRRTHLLGDARSASEGRRAVACDGAAATRRRHRVGRSRSGGCSTRPGSGSGRTPSHHPRRGAPAAAAAARHRRRADRWRTDDKGGRIRPAFVACAITRQ